MQPHVLAPDHGATRDAGIFVGVAHAMDLQRSQIAYAEGECLRRRARRGFEFEERMTFGGLREDAVDDARLRIGIGREDPAEIDVILAVAHVVGCFGERMRRISRRDCCAGPVLRVTLNSATTLRGLSTVASAARFQRRRGRKV